MGISKIFHTSLREIILILFGYRCSHIQMYCQVFQKNIIFIIGLKIFEENICWASKKKLVFCWTWCEMEVIDFLCSINYWSCWSMKGWLMIVLLQQTTESSGNISILMCFLHMVIGYHLTLFYCLPGLCIALKLKPSL